MFNDVAFFKSLPIVQFSLELEQVKEWSKQHKNSLKSAASKKLSCKAPLPPNSSGSALALDASRAGGSSGKLKDWAGPTGPTIKQLFEATDAHGDNIMQVAAYSGSADLVELFLDIQPSENKRKNAEANNLLHYAVKGPMEMAETIVGVRTYLLHHPDLRLEIDEMGEIKLAASHPHNHLPHHHHHHHHFNHHVSTPCPESSVGSEESPRSSISSGSGEILIPSVVPGFSSYALPQETASFPLSSSGKSEGNFSELAGAASSKPPPGIPLPQVNHSTTAASDGDSQKSAPQSPNLGLFLDAPISASGGSFPLRNNNLGFHVGAAAAAAASEASGPLKATTTEAVLTPSPLAPSPPTLLSASVVEVAAVVDELGSSAKAPQPLDSLAPIRIPSTLPTPAPPPSFSSSLLTGVTLVPLAPHPAPPPAPTPSPSAYDEEKHDPLKIHGLEYLRGLLQYTERYEQHVDETQWSLGKVARDAAIIIARQQERSRSVGVSQGGAGVITAAGGSSGGSRGEGGAGAAPLAPPSHSELSSRATTGSLLGDDDGSVVCVSCEPVEGGGCREAAAVAAAEFPTGNLSLRENSSSSAPILLVESNASLLASRPLIMSLSSSKLSQAVENALASEPLVGHEYIGHGEGGTLPYLDPRFNCTRQAKFSNINTLPAPARFPARSILRTIAVLLHHGANPLETNKYGVRPVEVAEAHSRQSNPEMISTMASPGGARVLLDPPWHYPPAHPHHSAGLLDPVTSDWRAVAATLAAAGEEIKRKKAEVGGVATTATLRKLEAEGGGGNGSEKIFL